MSSGASSSSAPPAAAVGDGYWEARDEAAAEVGDGYWEARDEAAAWLEAMAARARGEDELSEEQADTNNQLQEDEAGYCVLALQAIYGDDMVILEKEGLRSFQIYVRYPLPNGTQVFLNLRPNGTTVGTDNGGNQDGGELLFACSLKHLPPVVLTCLLPRSYPSACAPYFTISAKWLDGPKVSYLCAVLDEIWTELPGQEVVYKWVDWLNNSSWPCISLNDNIILAPDRSSAVADERAIARRLLVDSTIPLMQSYNEKRSHEIFLQSLHECSVCLSENTVPLPPSVLKSLLGDDGYTQWESFALQKLLDTMPDLVYCPRCDAACLEVDNDAQCPECFFTFCSLCKGRRHVGQACVTPAEKIRILRERQNKYFLPEKQLLKEQREIDELISVCEALRYCKQCPSCKMGISKTHGCNKMTCRNCGKFFCYRCNQAIKGYDHFWNGDCLLFEYDEWRRYPAQNRDLHDDEDSDEDPEELEPEWGQVYYYPCPICGRRNEKDGYQQSHIVRGMPRPLLCAMPEEGLEEL
ncbi:hypothetical protein ACP70R_027618 [Stipagrostis hirtigluma subsp. patula]